MQGSKRGERTAVEKPLRGNPKTGFPLRLEIPPTARDSHFPTAATAAVVRLHRKCPDNLPESYILKWLDTDSPNSSPWRWICYESFPRINHNLFATVPVEKTRVCPRLKYVPPASEIREKQVNRRPKFSNTFGW